MAEITLTVTDAAEARSQEVTVPDDVAVIRVIAKLLELMKLPLMGPDGQPLAYKFHHRASGRQLRDDDTFGSAGVGNGDTVRLLAEITAG